ncbi:hypothetical protein WDW86_17995 [Bdellovibrionota bacterium FG-2]
MSRTSFSLSLFIHLLMLGSLFCYTSLKPKDSQRSVETFIVETGTADHTGPHNQKTQKVTHARASRRTHIAKKSIRFGDGDFKKIEKPGRGGEARQDGYDIARSLKWSEENRSYPFFQALWKRIDSSTNYPIDLAKRRITGSVEVQFTVNRQGEFTREFLSAESDSLHSAVEKCKATPAFRPDYAPRKYCSGGTPRSVMICA